MPSEWNGTFGEAAGSEAVGDGVTMKLGLVDNGGGTARLHPNFGTEKLSNVLQSVFGSGALKRSSRLKFLTKSCSMIACMVLLTV